MNMNNRGEQQPPQQISGFSMSTAVQEAIYQTATHPNEQIRNEKYLVSFLSNSFSLSLLDICSIDQCFEIGHQLGSTVACLENQGVWSKLIL